jgi:hypothetical protein
MILRTRPTGCQVVHIVHIVGDRWHWCIKQRMHQRLGHRPASPAENPTMERLHLQTRKQGKPLEISINAGLIIWLKSLMSAQLLGAWNRVLSCCWSEWSEVWWTWGGWQQDICSCISLYSAETERCSQCVILANDTDIIKMGIYQFGIIPSLNEHSCFAAVCLHPYWLWLCQFCISLWEDTSTSDQASSWLYVMKIYSHLPFMNYLGARLRSTEVTNSAKQYMFLHNMRRRHSLPPLSE